MYTQADKLLEEISKKLCSQLTNRVIRGLQSLDHQFMLSGDDSGLKNVWDEICVQMEVGYSSMWDAYEDTINNFVIGELDKLTDADFNVIAYSLWDNDEEEISGYSRKSLIPELSRIISDKLILSAAKDWSNDRIRMYLENH